MGSGPLCQHVIEESWPLAKGYCEQLRGWIKKIPIFAITKGTPPQRIYAEKRKGEIMNRA